MSAPTMMSWLCVVSAVIGMFWLLNSRQLTATGGMVSQLFSYLDFRDTVTAPIRDFWNGFNPYSVHYYLQRNPGHQEFDLYLPHALLLFLPWGLAPATVAAKVWLLMNLAVLGALTARGIWAARCDGHPVPPSALPIALLVVLARPPGLLALASGQAGILTAAGAYAALTCRSVSLASAGLMLAFVKPQVGIGTLIVLLVLRRRMVVLWGTGAVVALSAPIFGILAMREGGVGPLLRVLADNVRFALGGTELGTGSAFSRPVDVVGVLNLVIRGPVSFVMGGLLCGAAVWIAHRWIGAVRAAGARHPEPPRLTSPAALWAALATVAITPNEVYALVALIPSGVALICSWLWPAPETGRRLAWQPAAAMVVILAVLIRSEAVERLVGVPALISQCLPGIGVAVALVLLTQWFRDPASRQEGHGQPTPTEGEIRC